MMDCLDDDGILDFLDGTGPGDRGEVTAHLAGCATCRAAVAAMARASDGATAPAGGEVVAPPPAIGRFVLESVIGAGGMGVVYRAWDPDLERRVALKRVRPVGGDPARTEEARARLLREARALARLAHPNVVAIHEVGVHDGDVTIAMEYVAGGNLRAWLAAAPRDRAAIHAVLAAAGAGLAAAHGAGLVHRDVKPDNILVGDDGRVRVVDFGLVAPDGAAARDADARVAEARDRGDTAEARDTDTRAAEARDRGDSADARDADARAADPRALTRTGIAVGTPAFMAPEQRRGEVAGAPADQWSFAVTACVALTGERPALEGEPPRVVLPDGLTAGERRVLARALALAPADRFPSLAALLAALARAAVPPRPRAPRVAIAIAVVAAAGLAAALVLGHVAAAPDHPVSPAAQAAAARVELALAAGHARTGAAADAETAAREAIRIAALAGDDTTLADAWILLIHVLADQDRLGDAAALRDVADAAVARAGGDPRRRARFLAALVELAMWTKELTGAIARTDRELPALVAALGVGDRDVIALASLHAEALAELGRVPDAWTWSSRALAAASASGDEALAIAARRVHGVVLLALGQADAARAHFEAVAAWGDAHGAAHPDRYFGHLGLAWCELSAGELARAEAELAQARAATVAAGAAGDFRATVALAAFADLRAMQGDLAGAEAAWAEVVRLRRARRPPRHVTIARALSGHGGAALARGDAERAAPILAEAVALLAADPTAQAAPSSDLGLARLRLARARWDSGDRGAALVLAGQVLPHASPDAGPWPPDGAALERWVIALCHDYTCPPP